MIALASVGRVADLPGARGHVVKIVGTDVVEVERALAPGELGLSWLWWAAPSVWVSAVAGAARVRG